MNVPRPPMPISSKIRPTAVSTSMALFALTTFACKPIRPPRPTPPRCQLYPCRWANQTVSQSCVVENTAYIVYGASGEFVDIVSRSVRLGLRSPPCKMCSLLNSGNCVVGLYCDAVSKQCMQEKALGDACTADKEWVSYTGFEWLFNGNGIAGAARGTASAAVSAAWTRLYRTMLAHGCTWS